MGHNLDNYQEVTNLNFRGKRPHIAVTCPEQGGPCNGETNALMFKSGKIQPVNEELLKSVEGLISEEELKKASFENHRQALEEALIDTLKSMSGEDYVFVYVADFNDNLVIFNYRDDLYAVTYTVSEDGVVKVGIISEGSEETQEVRRVKRRNMYVDSDTGEELIKAVDWLKTLSDKIDGEGSDGQSLENDSGDPDSNIDDEGETEGNTEDPEIVNEDTMTDKVKIEDLDLEELTKSAAVQELIKAAVAEAELAKVAELEKAKLVEDTTELVKGFKGVEESEVEVLVKALTSVDEEFGAALFKAFDGMQEAVKEAKAEVEEIKKSFGEKQDGIEGETTSKTTVAATEGKQRTNDLAALVKARKAEQSK